MRLKEKIAGTGFTNGLTETLFNLITLAGDVFIGKVYRNPKMIAVQLEQVNNSSSLAGQYMRLHTGDLWSQMNGQQHKVDGQTAPEKEEAFQLQAESSYAPMLRLSLLPVGNP